MWYNFTKFSVVKFCTVFCQNLLKYGIEAKWYGKYSNMTKNPLFVTCKIEEYILYLVRTIDCQNKYWRKHYLCRVETLERLTYQTVTDASGHNLVSKTIKTKRVYNIFLLIKCFFKNTKLLTNNDVTHETHLLRLY